MEIRTARRSDREQVQELLGSVWSDDYVAECWDDWVEHPEQGIPLLACADHRLLGVAYVHFLSQRVAWLQALRVHPQARRMGVGSALSQACLERARLAGRSVARLLIDADNVASAAMTAQAGFHQVLNYCKLQRRELRDAGPRLSAPAWEQLPALCQLARGAGHRHWHYDWETRDLSEETLQLAWQAGVLRVLADRPLLAVAAVNAYDDEFDVSEPVGDPSALLDLVWGLESEAKRLGKPQVELFLPDDSPLVKLLVQRGGYQLLADDGHTIWEYTLI